MDWETFLYNENEKPLDRLVDGYSNTSIFRTMAVVGDSLSSGEFEIMGTDGVLRHYDLYEYSWGQFLARKNAIKVYNFSRGGMMTNEYLDSFAEKNAFWGKDKACQAYVIALGVNDIYGHDMEIGTIDDVDVNDYNNNKANFIGRYATIVSRYKEISPDAKFFFVTFPNSDTPSRDDKTHGMIKALYSLSEVFDNSYVIDLYKYGPVFDRKFEKNYFLRHHMSPAGYNLFAHLIDSYIDYIIRHNPDDFKFVAVDASGIDHE